MLCILVKNNRYILTDEHGTFREEYRSYDSAARAKREREKGKPFEGKLADVIRQLFPHESLNDHGPEDELQEDRK